MRLNIQISSVLKTRRTKFGPLYLLQINNLIFKLHSNLILQRCLPVYYSQLCLLTFLRLIPFENWAKGIIMSGSPICFIFWKLFALFLCHRLKKLLAQLTRIWQSARWHIELKIP